MCMYVSDPPKQTKGGQGTRLRLSVRLKAIDHKEKGILPQRPHWKPWPWGFREHCSWALGESCATSPCGITVMPIHLGSQSLTAYLKAQEKHMKKWILRREALWNRPAAPQDPHPDKNSLQLPTAV